MGDVQEANGIKYVTKIGREREREREREYCVRSNSGKVSYNLINLLTSFAKVLMNSTLSYLNRTVPMCMLFLQQLNHFAKERTYQQLKNP